MHHVMSEKIIMYTILKFEPAFFYVFFYSMFYDSVEISCLYDIKGILCHIPVVLKRTFTHSSSTQ